MSKRHSTSRQHLQANNAKPEHRVSIAVLAVPGAAPLLSACTARIGECTHGWGTEGSSSSRPPWLKTLQAPPPPQAHLQDLEHLLSTRVKLLCISVHLLQGCVLFNVLVDVVAHSRQGRVPAGHQID